MFNPNDPRRTSRAALIARWALLVSIAAPLMPVPAAASTKLTGELEPAPSLDRSSKAKTTAATTGGYRVRCWQHGRLLFEETHVTLPDTGSRFTLKLTGYDSNGRPMYVAETQNATCLVRYDRTLFNNPALPR